MSFAIIKLQKFKLTDLKIAEKLEKTFSNTKNNHFYKKLTATTLKKAVKERIEELNLKRSIRKDAILLVQCVVTSDKTFFDKVNKELFFQKSFNFFEYYFGANNIISATVDYADKTPKLYVNFVPITNDNRLSAKSLISKNNLIKLHNDFYENVGKQFGLIKKDNTYKNLNEDFQENSVNYNNNQGIDTDAIQIQLNKLQKKNNFLEHIYKDYKNNISINKKLNFELNELNKKYNKLENYNNKLLGRMEILEKQNKLFKESIIFLLEILLNKKEVFDSSKSND